MPNALAKSFRDALSGISYVLRTQRNARIHLAITVLIFLLGLWLRLDLARWATLAIVAGLVWTAELINTAIEVAIDLVSPQTQPLAGIAKDVSAGAVLVGSAAAVIVGILILAPPLLNRIIP